MSDFSLTLVLQIKTSKIINDMAKVSKKFRAVFSVFCCGGDCMEDLNLYLKDVLAERPHTRVPSADTVLRGIEELATENISYTAEKTGNVYSGKSYDLIWAYG